MPGKRSNAYWEQRAADRMDGYLRGGERTLRIVNSAYQKALDGIQDDIHRIYGNYARRNGLTPEEAKAYLAQTVGQEEQDRLIAQIARVQEPALKRELIARQSAPAYQYRMSRLQALQENIHAQVMRIADVELGESTAQFKATIRNAYGRSLFDLQRGTGYGFSVVQISTGALEEILRNPWSGEHYSSRIWENTHVLSDWLQEDLTAGMLRGLSADRLAEDLAGKLGVGYESAERLVLTETAFMANAAEMRAYANEGVNRYKFRATLDGRTSERCQELDNETFAVAEAMPGENMPPMHPRCRSYTTAEIDDPVVAEFKRRAIDPETGEETLVPADMKYGEWKERYLREPQAEKTKINAGKTLTNDELWNIEALTDYAEKYLWIEEVDLRGMDPVLAQGTLEELERVYKEFPQLKGFISTLMPGSDVLISASPNGAMNNIIINWNAQDYADAKAMRALIAEAVEDGLFPAGTDWRANVTHEAGHALEALLISREEDTREGRLAAWNDGTLARRIVKGAQKAIVDAGGKMQSIDTISEYASESNGEAFAEAVSDWMTNRKRAKPLSRAIIEQIRRQLDANAP